MIKYKKVLIIFLMFIVLLCSINCISAVSENSMNNTVLEDSQNNLISISYDEQSKINVENDSALITQSNGLLQQKIDDEEDILKASPINGTV